MNKQELHVKQDEWSYTCHQKRGADKNFRAREAKPTGFVKKPAGGRVRRAAGG